jgi:hypothetical protein
MNPEDSTEPAYPWLVVLRRNPTTFFVRCSEAEAKEEAEKQVMETGEAWIIMKPEAVCNPRRALAWEFPTP